MNAGQELLHSEAGSPARLAALFYQQLEAGAAKDANLAQSAKCLVFLSLHMYQADQAAGRLPAQRTAAPADAGDLHQ